MTDELSSRARALLTEIAGSAPELNAPVAVEVARRRVRRRRTSVLLGAAAMCVVLVAAWVAAPRAGADRSPSEGYPQAVGAVPGPPGRSCSEMYSLDALRSRAFAFDGELVSIQPLDDERAAAAPFKATLATLVVHEWFSGGEGERVEVEMLLPAAGTGATVEPPPVELGSRLLVSGELRAGGTSNEVRVAFGCGFTRYYDEATASQWRQLRPGAAG